MQRERFLMRSISQKEIHLKLWLPTKTCCKRQRTIYDSAIMIYICVFMINCRCIIIISQVQLANRLNRLSLLYELASQLSSQLYALLALPTGEKSLLPHFPSCIISSVNPYICMLDNQLATGISCRAGQISCLS